MPSVNKHFQLLINKSPLKTPQDLNSTIKEPWHNSKGNPST